MADDPTNKDKDKEQPDAGSGEAPAKEATSAGDAAAKDTAAKDAATEDPRPAQPPARTASGTIDAGRGPKESDERRERSSSPYAPDERTPIEGARRPRHWGLPVWGWVILIGTSISALLLVLDLRNRDRYLLVCKAQKVELHKGRTFPWPFGHEVIGGPEYRPIEIPAEADCRDRVFHSQEEAELAFLDYLLSQVRDALANPGTADLNKARAKVRQALLISRTHRSRRKEAQKMLAELAYRAGRAGLQRAENELRKALGYFQEAQKLNADKFDDLDDWIAHLEELLRGVSPSPGSALTRPVLPPGFGNPPPMSRPPLPGLSPLPGQPPASAPSTSSPDAGPPQGGGGILM
jgi:hypothetical protein